MRSDDETNKRSKIEFEGENKRTGSKVKSDDDAPGHKRFRKDDVAGCLYKIHEFYSKSRKESMYFDINIPK